MLQKPKRAFPPPLIQSRRQALKPADIRSKAITPGAGNNFRRQGFSRYIYIYIYPSLSPKKNMYIHTYIHIYIYTYIYRERERDAPLGNKCQDGFRQGGALLDRPEGICIWHLLMLPQGCSLARLRGLGSSAITGIYGL